MRFPLYGETYSCDFRPGTEYFICINTDNKIYELYTYSRTWVEYDNSDQPLYTASYAPDGSYFMAAGQNGIVYMFNATNRVNTL